MSAYALPPSSALLADLCQTAAHQAASLSPSSSHLDTYQQADLRRGVLLAAGHIVGLDEDASDEFWADMAADSDAIAVPSFSSYYGPGAHIERSDAAVMEGLCVIPSWAYTAGQGVPFPDKAAHLEDAWRALAVARVECTGGCLCFSLLLAPESVALLGEDPDEFEPFHAADYDIPCR